MEESQNFGHEHPLTLLDEEQIISHGSEEAECWRCGEKVSAPSFGCLQSCGFYLHKGCAEAPLEINHPFHPDHPLILLQNPPPDYDSCPCDFCNKECKMFLYHCSCQLNLHIKCALFTLNIAEKNLKELEHVALKDPFVSTENDGEEMKDVGNCFGCLEPLSSYAYYSPDCGFNMHKKCVELPFKMNHAFHRKHSLVLQFNAELRACKICQRTWRPGFVYCCSLCKFVVDIECVLPPPIIEDKSHHPHTLTLFWPRSPLICDACGTGTEGSHPAYICAICNIIVHKKCISIPHVINHRWHIKHRVFHKYFIQADDLKSRDCIKCHEEVNIEYGSYHCAICDIIFHVNCARKEKRFYDIVSEDADDILAPLPDVNSIIIIETNDAGEAKKVKHFLHMHNLILSDKIVGDHKCCDGCMLPISASFYYCSVCNFFLHKDCAEMPKMMNFWTHRTPVFLIPNCIFRCEICKNVSNAFAYKCNECEKHSCLRCVSTIIPGAETCLKHEHPLLLYYPYKGECDSCGELMDEEFAFCCKDCSFAIGLGCLLLPITARHKCDDHVLALTYGDDNNYKESHYCDICEKTRDSKYWFYHCVTCDTSAHIKCVLGAYPFVKVGSTCAYEDHQHPLTFVKKAYYYPSNCMECDDPCEDLSLECATDGCNYIVHMDCIDYEDLKAVSALEKSEDESGIGQDT